MSEENDADSKPQTADKTFSHRFSDLPFKREPVSGERPTDRELASVFVHEKGKPAARPGRKAKGQPLTAAGSLATDGSCNLPRTGWL